MWQDFRFSVPGNPIIDAYDQCGGLGSVGVHIEGGLGACCSSCATGKPCCGGSHGLGDLSESFGSIMDTLNQPSPILGLPWLYVGVGVIALYFLFGTRVEGSEYKYQRMKARRDYQEKLKSLKDEYPTRGRHAGQHIAGGYRALKAL